MPLYNYICNDCRSEAEKVKGSELLVSELGEVIFETSHRMEPSDAELAEARICPRCNGSNTEKTHVGCNVICYVRGNGYLDRAGCHRDMNLHTLENGDPYAEMREPGEVDDLKQRIKKAGQHNPNAKHFVT